MTPEQWVRLQTADQEIPPMLLCSEGFPAFALEFIQGSGHWGVWEAPIPSPSLPKEPKRHNFPNNLFSFAENDLE